MRHCEERRAAAGSGIKSRPWVTHQPRLGVSAEPGAAGVLLPDLVSYLPPRKNRIWHPPCRRDLTPRPPIATPAPSGACLEPWWRSCWPALRSACLARSFTRNSKPPPGARSVGKAPSGFGHNRPGRWLTISTVGCSMFWRRLVRRIRHGQRVCDRDGLTGRHHPWQRRI